jgi:cellulose synthase/poly-beta-1,6-N-acetylglucosamine synthase-like glycosyltransferase
VVIARRFRCDTVATWESSRLTEDTALGIALASEGYPPLFTSEARGYSYFPLSRAGSEQQRERWEKGHLDNIVDLVPVALAKSCAIKTLVWPRSPSNGDASFVVVCACHGFARFSAASHLCWVRRLPPLPLLSTLFLVPGTMLAWIVVGRDVPLRELLHLPLHATQKFGFYQRIASGTATSAWISTDRK